MRKIGIIIAVTLGIVAGSTGREQVWAQQKPIEIRFGHVGFPNSLFDIVVNEYAKRVNAALQGRVEVKVFHSSQLGTDEVMVKGIKVGALEMFLPSTIMSTVEPSYGVFEMPYIIVNRAHMKKVSADPRVKAALLEPLPAKFHEVQKYLSLTGHVYTPAYPAISEAFWQKLPKDIQQSLEKIAVEMGDFARSEGERLDNELASKLTSGQMKMNEVDKETFIRASAPIYHEFAVEVKGGGDLVKLIQSLR